MIHTSKERFLSKQGHTQPRFQSRPGHLEHKLSDVTPNQEPGKVTTLLTNHNTRRQPHKTIRTRGKYLSSEGKGRGGGDRGTLPVSELV